MRKKLPAIFVFIIFVSLVIVFYLRNVSTNNGDVLSVTTDNSATLNLGIKYSSIQNSNYIIHFSPGKNLLDIMNDYNNEFKGLEVKSKSMDFGEFITGLNGVEANKNEFWNFKINGLDSFVGVSKYFPNNSDNILFILTIF